MSDMADIFRFYKSFIFNIFNMKKNHFSYIHILSLFSIEQAMRQVLTNVIISSFKYDV